MPKKVALITGAARGIGRGIALALAGNGFNIVVNDIAPQELAEDTLELLKSFKTEVLYCKADISSRADRNSMIKEIQKYFGRLDVLVNNAGIAPKQRMSLLEMDEESYDSVMNINLRGPFFLTQAVANWMIVQKAENNGIMPMIINISSISAYTSSPLRGQYCISKAGLSMMTKLFSDQLGGYNIPVYEIRPGIIATDMTKTVKEKYDKL
ncbi:MAG: 3-ketoacyl-ACP reductase, partial [bacterium]